jgi:hypothetical protein
MKCHSPSSIISRFNKHASVRGKYLVDKICGNESEISLLEFKKDERNFTIVTNVAIKGFWNATEYSETHSLGNLTYEMIDEGGAVITNKSEITKASGVMLNGKSFFWIPQDALIPFCNLLNFIK